MEGLLFAFHLKGTALDWRLHFLLVLVIFLGAATTLAENAHPQAVLLSTLRAQLVLLQGIWFVQIAEILYRGAPAGLAAGLCLDSLTELTWLCAIADRIAWDPEYMGSGMFVPVVFCVWVVVVLTGTVAGACQDV